jgi:hypothetical protein
MSKKRLEYARVFDLDVQIFQQLPLYIRKRIIGEAKILYCKNSDLLYDLAFQTIKEFDLFEKGYRMYLEKVQHG